MNSKTQQQEEIDEVSRSTPTPPPGLFTIKQFSKRNQAFSEFAVRNIRFKSQPRPGTNGSIEANGFAPAFVTVGRKVLVDEDVFFTCIRRGGMTVLSKEKAVAETTAQSNTKRKYHKNILADVRNLVKKYCNRISLLCSSYIQKHRENGATLYHYQEISDPDGPQLRVKRIDALVSIVDAKGNMVRFSGYLVPELREALLAVEKNTQGRAIR